MPFQSACANCGSCRTHGFYSGYFKIGIACDDCSHVEYRDDSDFDDDLQPAGQDAGTARV